MGINMNNYILPTVHLNIDMTMFFLMVQAQISEFEVYGLTFFGLSRRWFISDYIDLHQEPVSEIKFGVLNTGLLHRRILFSLHFPGMIFAMAPTLVGPWSSRHPFRT